ncbi:MAG: NAD(P)/FAD-dependent oxidoreductase [Bdellovibrionales bacterium]
MKPKVSVIGGGFSGLVTARALLSRGFQVQLFEKQNHFGGMIQSPHHELGIYETAANGLMNALGVRELFVDAGVPMQSPPRAGRRRYIYRDQRLRQWPLSFMETTRLIISWSKSRFSRRHLPLPEETIEQWCARVLTKETFRHLVAPALQGIYAGDSAKLSASLLLHRLLSGPRHKVHPRGTVFAPKGLQQLMIGLGQHLLRQGAELHLGQAASPEILNSSESLVVIAANAPAAARLLEPGQPKVAGLLERIEMLSLVTVQVFADPNDQVIDGFGALFPRESGIRSLGVLGDHVLFPQRSHLTSERWILGGATDVGLEQMSDQQIVDVVRQDRARLGGGKSWQGQVITRWPQALPHYTVELERVLKQIQLPDNIALIGNYLGSIGLSQILQSADQLAQKWEARFGR